MLPLGDQSFYIMQNDGRFFVLFCFMNYHMTSCSLILLNGIDPCFQKNDVISLDSLKEEALSRCLFKSE